jgi:hypothetical protein
MTEISGFPTITMRYDKDGHPVQSDHRERLRAFVKDKGITDLLVLSHGWNNDDVEAMAHYTELGAALARQVAQVPSLAGRRFGLGLVFWPSKAIRGFDRDDPRGGGGAAASAVTRQGAGAAGEAVDPEAMVEEAIADLGLPDDEAARLRAAAKAAIEDEDRFDAFFDEAVSAFSDADRGAAEVPTEPDVDPVVAVPDEAEEADTDLMNVQDTRPRQDALRREGRAAGAPEDFVGHGAGGGVRGAGNAVVGALNVLTFYTMKRRAGHVGSRGVASTLAGLRLFAPGLRIHMSGHSFGARVLTMATLALNGSHQARPNTLCLIQAAFSHNSFSDRVPPPKGGFFRAVVANRFVDGEIIVTHTLNDRAVHIAYSIASAAVREQASQARQPSRYGGLGANGTRHTPEAKNIRMLPPGTPYNFSSHDLWNLDASDFVSGHSDVRNDGVAFAICSAIGA